MNAKIRSWKLWLTADITMLRETAAFVILGYTMPA
jgi:hypothetical protein